MPGRKYLAGSLLVLAACAIRMLLAQRKQVETELKAIAWLLVLVAGAVIATPSNKWRIQVSSDADSDG